MKSGCQKTEKAKKLLNNQEFSVLAENERQGFIQVILRLNEDIEKQNKTIETLLKKLDEVEKELSLTRAKLRLSNSNIYGRRSESLYPSEKGGPIQHYFDFDSDTPYPVKPASEETTKVSDSIKPEKSEEKKAEPVMTAVAAYTRAKTGRKPLSPDLPRIIVTHDVPEEDKICACGCQKIIMKEIVSEKLVKPRSSPYVIKDIRYARVCPECEGTATEGISPTVETAPVQNQLISKSIATSSLVADIMDLKFNNSLPFYRISNMLKTDGISVTRATMCNWTIKISARLKPMMELFHEKLMESSVIFADETTLQVNKEPGRKPSSKSYVWVLRSGGINAPPTVYFHYEPSRAQKVAMKLLSGYKGHLMTDGFDGYNFADKKNSNITHLCCWAHCRRKFYDAYKILDEKQRKRSYSFLAIKYIQKIYKVEEDIRNRLSKGENLTADQIFSIRIQNSKPVLEKLERRLKQWQGKVTPKSLTGIAVRYALNMWSKLIRYLEDGNLPIDNNPAENALRSLCVSRKNWLFCDTPEGADAAAIMLSLISTCKANGMQPYWYMRYLFDHLPGFKTKDDFKAFMPQVMDKTVLEDYIKKTNIQDQENLKIALEQSHTEK